MLPNEDKTLQVVVRKSRGEKAVLQDRTNQWYSSPTPALAPVPFSNLCEALDGSN
jgi:hypothetical protein